MLHLCPKLTPVFLCLLLSASLSAQLRTGDQFIGFGPHLPIAASAGAVPALPSDLIQLGSTFGSDSYAMSLLPSYGRMITDYLQLYGSAAVANSLFSDDFQASLALGARGYLTNRPHSAVFVGANYLLARDGSYAMPTVGLSAAISDHARVVPEVGYRVAVGGDQPQPDAVALTIGVELLFNDRMAADSLAVAFEPGTTLLGVSSISWTRQPEDGAHLFLVSPSVQYMVGRTTGLGVQAQYVSTGSNTERSVAQFGIGPMVRQFLGTGGPFSTFLEVGVTHQGSLRNRHLHRSGTFRSGHAAAGLFILLRPDIALETSLSYQRVLGQPGRYNPGNYLSLNLGGRLILPGTHR